MRSKLLFIVFLFLMLFYTKLCCAQNNNNATDTENLFWRPKLEEAFNKTFNSPHEFAACQIFQLLGYDLAEISQINKITPKPATLKIEFKDMEEVEEPYSYCASQSVKVIKFKELNVVCTRVHYFGMVIERVIFGFPESSIEYDTLNKGRIRFNRAKEITMNVSVSESDLLSVMNLYAKSKALSSVKLRLANDKINAVGRVNMGIFVAEFKVKGHIQKISPKQVNFVCEKLTINNISQPRAFVGRIVNYVNPVFDSTKIWINLNVSEMKLIKGFVESKATINKKEIKNGN